MKRYPVVDGWSWAEGFESYPVDEMQRAYLNQGPDFDWDTPAPGIVSAYCPTWFPGTLLGGLLLG